MIDGKGHKELTHLGLMFGACIVLCVAYAHKISMKYYWNNHFYEKYAN